VAEQPDFALYERVYAVVMLVPPGQVTSYGEVAQVLGGGVDGRLVGQALGALPEARAGGVPWQRVVAKDGAVSTRGLRQRELLAAEGVAFDEQGRAIMARHRWPGPEAAWAEANGCHTLPARDEGEQLSLF
jgi:methylated-DNA-protein-cysteine methyltransferase-like protein